MKKIFIDSSVLVAASASKNGASAFILGLCRKEKIKGLVSSDVIKEAQKNVNLKLGHLEKERLTFYLKKSNLYLLPDPEVESIYECEAVIEKKDAPVLAAALNSQADFLITLDRKHFLNQKVANFIKPMEILTPGDFIKTIRISG
jgi:putative PIN family toxin of toxin-antitoxin system